MDAIRGHGVSLSLTGRISLVTGGSRGIGAATVRLFRQAGSLVCFSHQKSHEQADALVAECGGEKFCRGVQQHLKTAADGHALVDGAVKAFGRLDCLVVNHGIWPSHDAPISSMTEEQWRETMAVNLDSVFGLVQAAVAQMEKQPAGADGVRGHIVLISSTAGQRGEAFHADYAASKGALISLTKSLSSELAAKRIYVNCVAPGWVKTEMSQAALEDTETAKKILSGIPLGRVASPMEIAGPVLFLCTPLAGFVSGEIFNVNGGAVLTG